MLIDDLLSYSKGSLERLTALEEDDPQAAVEVAWPFLQRAGVDGCHIRADDAHTFGRLVRDSLAFSKKTANHVGAIFYFLKHYNASLPF